MYTSIYMHNYSFIYINTYMHIHILMHKPTLEEGEKDCPLEGQASQPSKRAKMMLQAANQPITTDAKGTQTSISLRVCTQNVLYELKKSTDFYVHIHSYTCNNICIYSGKNSKDLFASLGCLKVAKKSNNGGIYVCIYNNDINMYIRV
jgi:hypothetical protein